MEWMIGALGALILVGLLIWLYRRTSRAKPKTTLVLPLIPEDYQIFAHDLGVMDGDYDKAKAFALQPNPRLGFFLAPTPNDPQRIEVVGYNDHHQTVLGYLPTDVAHALHASQTEKLALARLIFLDVVHNDVILKYQVLGPSTHKKSFLDALFVAQARMT